MALIASKNTQRLQLPETLPGVEAGDWIEILTMWTSGMRRRIMNRTLNINLQVTGTNAASSKSDVDVDVFASRQAVLEEIVVGWSSPEPVTPENLEQLRPEVQDWIAEQYDSLAAGRSDAEKKESSDSSSDTTPITEVSLTNSPISVRQPGSEVTV